VDSVRLFITKSIYDTKKLRVIDNPMSAG